MSMSLLRSRWAAIGAAVAVCLGAGGVGFSQAAPTSGNESVYTVITPCRLADTRAAPDTVGPRTTPLGAGEIYTLDGWGAVGNCTLPTTTSGLGLNVTAVNPTQLTYLTLWAANKPQPVTSNLNPAPGQPPTPNAVTVGLSSSGQFKVFNELGTVDVIVDVVGYYEDHSHQALQNIARHARGANLNELTGVVKEMTSVNISPARDGVIIANSSAYIFDSTTAGSVRCSINTSIGLDGDYLQYAEHVAGDGATIAGTRGFDVTAGESFTIRLVCGEHSGNTTLRNPSLTAVFVPD